MFCALKCSLSIFSFQGFSGLECDFFLFLSLVLVDFSIVDTLFCLHFFLLYFEISADLVILKIYMLLCWFFYSCVTLRISRGFPRKFISGFEKFLNLFSTWNFLSLFFYSSIKSFLFSLSASETEERLNHVFRWAKDVKSKISLMSRTFTTASRFLLKLFTFSRLKKRFCELHTRNENKN